MTFAEYLAAFAIGRLLSSDLPEAAATGLEEGLDSVDLAALAGSTPAERSPSELEEMWTRGLRALQRPVPSRADAGLTLRNYYVRRVASGELAPKDGAGEIVDLVRELENDLPSRNCVGDGLGVAVLVGLYYEYDDLEIDDVSDLERLDAQVRSECQQLARSPA